MADTSCPFCGYKSTSEYEILYHLESIHPEGESPFVVQEKFEGQIIDVEPLEESDHVECPISGCCEVIHLPELDSHLDLHGAECNEYEDRDEQHFMTSNSGDSDVSTSFENNISPELRNLDNVVSSTSAALDGQAKAVATWKEILHMPATGRQSRSSSAIKKIRLKLGTSELGPHANEKQMPPWLQKLLESDGQLKTISSAGSVKKMQIVENHASGILPVIEQLLRQDPLVEYAYTCHPSVLHISKLKNEGGFCGYRNIQMMTSFIIALKTQGYFHFKARVPTIFQIQDFIEHAWDIGINKQGRQETGGIRGTRKYIGTPEAQAMFCSLDIACDAQGLKTKANLRADQLLFQTVEDYFKSGNSDPTDKVRSSSKPPIYFQHPGHSMTIVGFEKRKDGSKNLLVFDPMFHDSATVTKLVGKAFIHKSPAELLRAYRRGIKYLRKYSEFEILKLTPPSQTV